MRPAEEYVREFWTDQHGQPWPTFVALLERVQRDALEAAARCCDEQAARCRNRDNEDGADAADACWRRIRALMVPDPLDPAHVPPAVR